MKKHEQKRFYLITRRNPFMIQTPEGEFELPSELVPWHMKRRPLGRYHDNLFYADIGTDSETRKIRYFHFERYMKKVLPTERIDYSPTLPDKI